MQTRLPSPLRRRLPGVLACAVLLASGCGSVGQPAVPEDAALPRDGAASGADRATRGDGATGADGAAGDDVAPGADGATGVDGPTPGDATPADGANAGDRLGPSDAGGTDGGLADGGPADGGGPGGVSVQGGLLHRDGLPWRPRGLSMIGALTRGAAVAARAHFGPAELAAAIAFGADTLRFQVSQPYLDPQDPLHDPAYLGELGTIVSATLDAGLVVVLSMQDQSLAGGDATPTPTAATTRAWAVLGPVYKNEPRVILELYNEPDTQADAAGWADWTQGDDARGIVGHQALVTQLRTLGATNVLFADGAQKGEILPPTAVLTDPLDQVVYAVHPYYLGPAGHEQTQWDARFGNLSATAPVVVSEWNNYSGGACNLNAPTLVPMLFAYLEAHHIGIYGWAFDLPGTLVQDFTWTPTNYTGYACGSGHHGGAGELLTQLFHAL
jgi:hypothetical protein